MQMAAERLAATLRMAHLAEPLMRKGGTLFTITLRQPNGGEELQHHGRRQSGAGSAVCYLAAEFGPKGIRVHTISRTAGTRAASGIPEFDELLDKARAKAPTLSLVSIDDVRVATALLAYDATRLITGETLYITAATTSSTSSPRLGPATGGAGAAPAPSMKR
jgi:enoyl-[acyl-carrier protein] reductase I